MKLKIALALLGLFMAPVSMGYAQDAGSSESSENAIVESCANIGNNSKWAVGLKELSALVTDKKYDEAHQKAKSLRKYCSRSPMLTYIEAKIAEGQGDDVESLRLLQRATEYAQEIVVPIDMTKKIWYARYEKENPGRTAASVGALQSETDALRAESKALQSESLSLLKKTSQLSTRVFEIQQATELETMRSEANKSMWTGIGIGIAGVALAGTGAALMATNNLYEVKAEFTDLYKDGSLDIDDIKNFEESKYKANPTYLVGIGLLGAGVAMVVTGTIFAGIYGYRYSHLKELEKVEVSLAPTGFSMTMSF